MARAWINGGKGDWAPWTPWARCYPSLNDLPCVERRDCLTAAVAAVPSPALLRRGPGLTSSLLLGSAGNSLQSESPSPGLSFPRAPSTPKPEIKDGGGNNSSRHLVSPGSGAGLNGRLTALQTPAPNLATAEDGVTMAERWVRRMLRGEGGAWRPELTELAILEQASAPSGKAAYHHVPFTRGSEQ